jgi:anthranilate synthase component 1
METMTELKEVRESYNLVPVVREMPADLDSPISAYLKLTGKGPSFLLESVTGGEQVARYSYIGTGLQQGYILRGDRLEHHTPDGVETFSIDEGITPFDLLRAELSQYQPKFIPNLPHFTGGMVGYLSYDTVRYFEPNVPLSAHPEIPEAIFLLADTLVAYDHAFGRMILIANVFDDGNLEHAYADAEVRLDDLEARLRGSLPPEPENEEIQITTDLQGNINQDEFVRMVKQAKEHITAGDIFQVVLSQRLERETSASPFSIYRSLRQLNPSPYMFYFDFDDLPGGEPMHIIGASPEMHTRLEGRRAAVRPIAGTRPRGKTREGDAAYADDLLSDPKERAEHIMLVDLGRNDLGRVCEYGSVGMQEQMVIERYSHVMHIVSHVEGDLRPELDAFDLLQATFPAGTVSGAPKIRAMQIIKDLEPEPRGPYAGVVGYFSFNGWFDSCITIRTLIMRGRRVQVQAGAGIVADSQPEREYQETLNKARALAVAIEKAEQMSYSNNGHRGAA